MTTKKLNKIKLIYKVRVFHLKDEFTISRGSKKLIKVIDIILKDGKCVGYGECIPYDRYNEKLTNILKYLKKNKTTLITKINEEKIETIPYFSLQNAISAALTDLNCKINNTSMLKCFVSKTRARDCSKQLIRRFSVCCNSWRNRSRDNRIIFYKFVLWKK